MCLVNNFKIGINGKHGLAWLFFTLAIALWYVAERLWELPDLTNSDFPVPYTDLFWFGGYALYFLFGVLYLKPFSSQISRKNILFTSLLVLGVLSLVFFTTMSLNDFFENFLNVLYPLADSVMLIPSILGMVLFFRGRVTFSWTLFFFGMLMFVIADYGFMYFNSTDEYYEGHLIDIPYLWAYSILIVGLIANLSLWHKTNKNNLFHEQDNMR